MSSATEAPIDMNQYEAVRRGVGWIDLSRRGKLLATGPDRVSFLHSMISNDVEKLEEMAGRYATFLTAQGKIVADFYIYKLADGMLLDLESSIVEKTREKLEQYIIMDDVELRDASQDYAHFSLQGPRSAELIRNLFRCRTPEVRLGMACADWQSQPVMIICKADLGSQGFELLAPAGTGTEIRAAAFESASGWRMEEISPQVQEVLRIESGIPLYGRELDESRYPMEARLDEALSFDKGCYIGQEVVAKATYIGGVSRRLVRIAFDPGAPPPQESRLYSREGKKAGLVTSSAYSPAAGGPIGLGYVKKAFAEPGTQLEAAWSEQERRPARIVEAFD